MNVLNKFFEKIYCINLEKRKDKWENCVSEFKKHSLTVERFNAIEGIPKDVNVTQKMLSFGVGAVGCSLSHIEIIKLAKQQNLKNVLILEDDVVFINDLNNRFEAYIRQIPEDWNLLYLSGNNIKSVGKLIQKTVNIFKTTCSLTTHSYAINNNMYDILIDGLEKLEMPVDTFYLEKVQPMYNCYIIRPHLSWQKEGYSDIQNKFTNYKQIKY